MGTTVRSFAAFLALLVLATALLTVQAGAAEKQQLVYRVSEPG